MNTTTLASEMHIMSHFSTGYIVSANSYEGPPSFRLWSRFCKNFSESYQLSLPRKERKRLAKILQPAAAWHRNKSRVDYSKAIQVFTCSSDARVRLMRTFTYCSSSRSDWERSGLFILWNTLLWNVALIKLLNRLTILKEHTYSKNF